MLIASFYLITSLFLLHKALLYPERIALIATPREVVAFALSLAVALIVGAGLLLLYNWARYLAVFHLILAFISFWLGGYELINPSTLIEIVLISYLLLHPACRRAFSD